MLYSQFPLTIEGRGQSGINRICDLDLVVGIGNNDSSGKEISLDVVWVENPMPKKPIRARSWKIHKAGNQKDYIKDINVADFDQDGKPDNCYPR